MSIVVERVQYGVGQGAFHTQSITIDEDCFWAPDLGIPPEGLQFDFVFDCGSDESKVPGALEASIKHYRPKLTRSVPVSQPAAQTTEADTAPNTPRNRRKGIVHALFISHFHDDHTSGIELLCEQKIVERIFAPYYTEDDVLAVILRNSEWLESSGASGEQAALFLREMGNLYRHERLFGRPTIYVIDPNLTDNSPLSPSLTDPALPPFPPGVQVSDSVNRQARFTDRDALEFGPARYRPSIWEIKTWCFRLQLPNPSAAWTTAIAKLRKQLDSIFKNRKAITPINAQTLLKKVHKIRKTLCAALKIEKVKHAGNHNVVSLCVYSGPPEYDLSSPRFSVQRMNGPSICNPSDIQLDFSLNSPRLGRLRGEVQLEHQDSQPIGWLGTGDAMLGDDAVWDDFDARLDWGTRSMQVATVQIPHHGSRGPYYNPELLGQAGTLAVISAAAYSSDRHPAISVLSDILQRGGAAVHIHEFVRPGLVEIVRMDF